MPPDLREWWPGVTSVTGPGKEKWPGTSAPRPGGQRQDALRAATPWEDERAWPRKAPGGRLPSEPWPPGLRPRQRPRGSERAREGQEGPLCPQQARPPEAWAAWPSETRATFNRFWCRLGPTYGPSVCTDPARSAGSRDTLPGRSGSLALEPDLHLQRQSPGFLATPEDARQTHLGASWLRSLRLFH